MKPTFLKLCLLSMLAVVGLLGCPPSASSPAPERDIARGAVLVVVEAVQVADAVCEDLAMTASGSRDEAKLKAAIALAKTCAKGKVAALTAAKAARALISAWDAERAGELGCAGARMLDGLNLVRDAIDGAGGSLPSPIEDGLQRAAWLAHFAAGTCPAGAP